MKRRLLSLLIATAIALGLSPTTALATGDSINAEDRAIMAGAAHIEGTQVDSVYFGTYPQSSDGNGGYYTDPIKWRVLSNAEGRLFLLSDQGLDVIPYSEKMSSDTWEESILREWMNGTQQGGFYADAFSSGEAEAIAYTNVKNEDNKVYNTDGGYDTTDKLFALSIKEASNVAYGFSADYGSTATREITITEYCRRSGEATNNWWLRSPGKSNYMEPPAGLTYLYVDQFACVYFDGKLVDEGVPMEYTVIAARPAFNLDLSKVIFTSAANGGKTSTLGEITEIPAYTGTEWKTTLLDSGRNSFTATQTAKNGNTVTVSYENAKTGVNEYLSVIISDSTGAYTHYGRVLPLDGTTNQASGTVDIDLSGINMSGKTLYVFNEQYNGGAVDDTKLTDYASKLIAVATTPYTVTFDANGHGTAPASVDASHGNKVVKPADPTATGYLFGGWFQEAACTNEWDFDADTVTASMTLYAKWTLCDHTGSTVLPTHTNSAVCSLCNGTIAEMGHSYNQEVATETYLKFAADCSNSAVYYKSCSCGASSKGTVDEAIFTIGDALAHTYNQEIATNIYLKSAANCTNPAIYYKSCSCGASSKGTVDEAIFTIGDALAHTYDQEIATDIYLKSAANCTNPAIYYKSCSCGASSKGTVDEAIFTIGDVLAHTYDQEVATDIYLKSAADCTNPAEYYKSCSCSASSKGTVNEVVFTSGSELGHRFTVLHSDDTHHWYKCENCDDTTTPEKHLGGIADCVAQAVCSVCDKAYGELTEHTAAGWWSKNEVEHWKTCCGDNCDAEIVSTRTAHTPKTINAKEATVNEKGYTGDIVCEVCGYEIAKGEYIPIIAAPNQPNENTPTSPQTGDNSNMLFLLVLLSLSGIGLMVVICYKKIRVSR